MPPVVLYFPFPSVGGVSVLFLRLAKYLSVHFDNVFIMDLPDGYMANNMPPSCHFIPYNKPDLLPHDSIVVLQSVPPWRLLNFKLFPPSAKIFYWNLHPYNLSPRLIQKGSRLGSRAPFRIANKFFSCLRKRKLRNLAELLIKFNAIVFMDQENHQKTSQELDMQFPLSYLPITTDTKYEEKEIEMPKRVFSGGELNFAWVGRLDDFKIPILLHLLSRLDAIQFLNIDFSIIGNGSQMSLVREHVESLDRLKVNFEGAINHAELDTHLLNQHIVFAMGTSALDAARLGIPTYCLDYSYVPIKGFYKFKLLRDAVGYNVGEEISERNMEEISSLEESLRNTLLNFTHECFLAHDYWKNNHSPGCVAALFVELSQNSALTFGDLVKAGLHKPDLFTSLFCKLDPRSNDGSGFILR